MNHSDDEDEPWTARTSARAPPRPPVTTLKSQLATIADQWERTKLTEVGALNRKILTLGNEKDALVKERDNVKVELIESKAETEAMKKERDALQEKVRV